MGFERFVSEDFELMIVFKRAINGRISVGLVKIEETRSERSSAESGRRASGLGLSVEGTFRAWLGELVVVVVEASRVTIVVW